jgi:hypothetical protein
MLVSGIWGMARYEQSINDISVSSAMYLIFAQINGMVLTM